nr:myb-related transcription factor, partner of profilin-like [Aegilops tauschii subsp. strangulata]
MEALQHASIVEEHHTLMGVVIEKIQSAKSGLKEAFTSLLIGFEASLLAATAQAAEVSKLKRKLGLADEDLIRINKIFDEVQGSAAAVEALRGELAQAQEQARVNKAAADKAAEDLKSAQVVRYQYEERVTEVEQALKDAADKCKSLEEKNVFADLPKGAADAAQFFWTQEGHATEKLFWSQFIAREHPALLNDQMAQWAELHRISNPNLVPSAPPVKTPTDGRVRLPPQSPAMRPAAAVPEDPRAVTSLRRAAPEPAPPPPSSTPAPPSSPPEPRPAPSLLRSPPPSSSGDEPAAPANRASIRSGTEG